MGNDPPGQFTRALHPRVGRHGIRRANVIPVGRSVIVPANGSLPNIVLSPRSVFRIRRVLERERFDVLHLHEPMTPAICIAVLALATTPGGRDVPRVGGSRLDALGMPAWGFLMDRIDRRIAVSERARASASRWLGATWEIVPNGVLVPEHADPAGREHTVVFAGRHEPRKGLHVLRAPGPRSGAARGRASSSPARPARRPAAPDADRRVRRGRRRRRLPQPDRADRPPALDEALVAPSLGGESFGMVLTRASRARRPSWRPT